MVVWAPMNHHQHRQKNSLWRPGSFELITARSAANTLESGCYQKLRGSSTNIIGTESFVRGLSTNIICILYRELLFGLQKATHCLGTFNRLWNNDVCVPPWLHGSTKRPHLQASRSGSKHRMPYHSYHCNVALGKYCCQRTSRLCVIHNTRRKNYKYYFEECVNDTTAVLGIWDIKY